MTHPANRAGFQAQITKRARAESMSLPSESRCRHRRCRRRRPLAAAHRAGNIPASRWSCWKRANRVGGRGHTIMGRPRHSPSTSACGWLHSADENSFVKIAAQLNFENRQDPPALGASRAFDVGFPMARADGFHEGAGPPSINRAEGKAAKIRPRTGAASLYLEPGNRLGIR